VNEFLQQNIIFSYIIIACFGLIIGSFLNVVIYRLPRILEADWFSQCIDFLKGQQASHTTIEPCPLCQHTTTPPQENQQNNAARSDKQRLFNLCWPPSHCPQCDQPIRAYDNIPLISYCFLRGKCRHCQHPIPKRYPLIEAMTALATFIVAWQIGFAMILIPALLLTYALLALSWIDFDHKILPDNITLPFLWLGLLVNSVTGFVPLQEALFGAVFGYLSLWSIYWIFKLTTGKEGMGYGDFKLLSLLGAWLGWKMLPFIILTSSCVGAIVGISIILLRLHKRSEPIPFGPYLALAGWIALLWGQPITQWYLAWV